VACRRGWGSEHQVTEAWPEKLVNLRIQPAGKPRETFSENGSYLKMNRQGPLSQVGKQNIKSEIQRRKKIPPLFVLCFFPE
jgi:hypothetical protein